MLLPARAPSGLPLLCTRLLLKKHWSQKKKVFFGILPDICAVTCYQYATKMRCYVKGMCLVQYFQNKARYSVKQPITRWGNSRIGQQQQKTAYLVTNHITVIVWQHRRERILILNNLVCSFFFFSIWQCTTPRLHICHVRFVYCTK